jgi:thiamine biosynthesis lipoprotein
MREEDFESKLGQRSDGRTLEGQDVKGRHADRRSIDRRRFLQACGALGLGAIAGGIVQARWDVVGLGSRSKKVSLTRTAMGTFVTVTAVHASRDLAQEAIGKAYEEMERLIAVFNRFATSSALSVLNRDGRLSGPPPELNEVLRWANHFNRTTGGNFDVTVKPLIDLFEETVGRDGRTFPSDEQISSALSLVDAAGVRIEAGAVAFAKPRMGVTLDGIAKGYIVDMMSAKLAEHGVHNHLVNAGGDIRTSGSAASGRAWTVAVEDPRKRRNYPDVIRMSDGAVATSGSYEIYYDGDRLYHHVVDPHTGHSPAYSTSTTVRAPSVMVADALSTAAFVVDPAAAVRLLESVRPACGATGLIIGADGSQHASAGWNSALS